MQIDPRRAGWPATAKQLDYLTSLGVNLQALPDLTIGGASALIDAAIAYRKAEPETLERMLKFWGLLEHLGTDRYDLRPMFDAWYDAEPARLVAWQRFVVETLGAVEPALSEGASYLALPAVSRRRKPFRWSVGLAVAFLLFVILVCCTAFMVIPVPTLEQPAPAETLDAGVGHEG